MLSKKREPIAGVMLPLAPTEHDAAARTQRQAALAVAEWAWRQDHTQDTLRDVLEILGIDADLIGTTSTTPPVALPA